MKTKALQDVFIKILRSELNETELDESVKKELTPDVIAALFSLSKRHEVSHIAASSLLKNGLLFDEEIKSKYNDAEIMSIYRCEQMRYAYEQICGTFDEESIPYIPLKGSVIRPYYPKESMRTSCDIDILIKEENIDAAIKALRKKGFKCGEKNYHDVSLFSPNKIHLELHFSIQENIDKLDAVLKDAWLYARPKNGCCYEFSEEFFVFYMFAHISYHFLGGGCGIRSLMDIWVMEHKMGITYLKAEAILKKADIYKFAIEITKLTDACFNSDKMDDFSKELLSYILKGGTYGSIQNNIAVDAPQSHLTASHALKRMKITRESLSIEYPILEKAPVLFIFCWIHRTARLIFRYIKRLFKKKKIKKHISENRYEKSKKMLKKLGL